MPIECDDEATTFEMNPLGARQRVLPSRQFVATVSVPVAVRPMPVVMRPTTIVPEFPAIATVMRVVTAPPVKRTMWPSIPLITVPLGAVFAVLVTVASFLLQPAEPQAPVIAIASADIGVEPSAAVAHLEAPAMSDEPEVVEVPKQRARKKSPRRPRWIVAGDTSTPLGDLRPHR